MYCAHVYIPSLAHPGSASFSARPRMHLSQRLVFGRLCFARASPRLVLFQFRAHSPSDGFGFAYECGRRCLPALVDFSGSTPPRRGGWTRAACGPIVFGGEPADRLCCEEM
jgi:hypothetical protein